MYTKFSYIWLDSILDFKSGMPNAPTDTRF